MNISDLAKVRLREVLEEGDWAVDATLGNGWDTVFLAKEVGSAGRVSGFDVQEEAVAASRKRLTKEGLLDRCELHLCGHERMADFVAGPLGAVIFNLGYFPYAGKNIVTQGETTVQALRVACELLRAGGMVTMACYVGHPGGREEAEQVLAAVQELGREFEVEAPQEVPAGENAFLIVIRRVAAL